MTDEQPGRVIDFQQEAIGRLRRRVAELDDAQKTLLAYARGHAGAVAQIHSAVLAAMDADSIDVLIHVITQDWVDMLGLDAVALALQTKGQGLRLGRQGVRFLPPETIAAWRPADGQVLLRGVGEGAELFGPTASLVRSEALIPLNLGRRLPRGVLGLGSRTSHNFEGVGGAELLSFLGSVTERLLERWLTKAL